MPLYRAMFQKMSLGFGEDRFGEKGMGRYIVPDRSGLNSTRMFGAPEGFVKGTWGPEGMRFLMLGWCGGGGGDKKKRKVRGIASRGD